MSSFWRTLKQQWTIKISSTFFLFLAWWPSWLEVGITGQIFVRGPSKDHSTKVWLQLAQWFLRTRLKCEILTDRRLTKSDDNSSHGLMARWAKNGKRFHNLTHRLTFLYAHRSQAWNSSDFEVGEQSTVSLRRLFLKFSKISYRYTCSISKIFTKS